MSGNNKIYVKGKVDGHEIEGVIKVRKGNEGLTILVIMVIISASIWFVITHAAFALFITSLPLMLVSLIVALVGIVKNRNRKLQYISLGILLFSVITIVITHLLPVMIIAYVLLVISLIMARIYRNRQFPLK